MRVHVERETRIAVPKPLLPYLQGNREPIHETAVGMPESVQAASLNSERSE